MTKNLKFPTNLTIIHITTKPDFSFIDHSRGHTMPDHFDCGQANSNLQKEWQCKTWTSSTISFTTYNSNSKSYPVKPTFLKNSKSCNCSTGPPLLRAKNCTHPYFSTLRKLRLESSINQQSNQCKWRLLPWFCKRFATQSKVSWEGCGWIKEGKSKTSSSK